MSAAVHLARNPFEEALHMNDEILRIAVASSEGGRVDQHFGHAEDFLVFDVSQGGTTLVERRAVRVTEDGDKRDLPPSV
jgi:hypothetical protein